MPSRLVVLCVKSTMAARYKGRQTPSSTPMIRDGDTVENFIKAGPRSGADVRRHIVQSKKPRLANFQTGGEGSLLEVSRNEQPHMITRKHHVVRKEAVKNKWPGRQKPGFLVQFPQCRLTQCFTPFNAAARKRPAFDIAMAHQHHLVMRVNRGDPDAQGFATAQAR